jgi:hypothetical protein
MRPFLAAVVTMAILAGSAYSPRPAYSQGSKPSAQDVDPANRDPLELKYERERREREENERQYNATMKRLKGQAPAATSSDPWKQVRPTDNSTAKR